MRSPTIAEPAASRARALGTHAWAAPQNLIRKFARCTNVTVRYNYRDEPQLRARASPLRSHLHQRRDSRGRSGLWALRLALEAVCVACPEYLGSGRCVSLSRRSVWRVPSMARATRKVPISDAGREVGHSIGATRYTATRQRNAEPHITAFEIDVLMSNASGLNKRSE